MEFNLGPIPKSPEFTPDHPWKPIREPGPILAQVFAIPLAIVAFLALAALWYFLTPISTAAFPSPILLIAITLLTIPVHEFAHLMVHPHFGFSALSVVGFWPSRLLCYAHYHGELSRNRMIAMFAMPIIILSALPFIFCAVTGYGSWTLAFLCVFNFLCASLDVLGICLFLWQIPGNAIVRNQEWGTFWRLPAKTTDLAELEPALRARGI